ncbi:MAG: hypothetical protein EXS13_04035 [Planctomycetes bacterium]|nr:hypothetical protein [Planctomycetota bacterium]
MLWCEECLGRHGNQGKTFWNCRCGGRAETLPDSAAEERRAYERWIGNAIRAPLSGSGLKLMLVGSACYGAIDAWLGQSTRDTLALIVMRLAGGSQSGLRAMPPMHDMLLSATGIALFAIVLGYQFAWFLQVIQNSARGRPALENFPDFTSFSDSVMLPAMQGFAALVGTVAPGLLAMLAGPVPPWIGGLIAFVGFLALPMALASIALDGSLRGLDPGRIAAGIRTCGIEYAFATALFVAMTGAIAGGSLFFGNVPWIGPFVKAFVILSSSAMAAQVLSLVIARKERQLGGLAGLRHRARVDRAGIVAAKCWPMRRFE